jgi:hypothetical protein
MYFISNVMAMHALSHLRSYIFTAIMNLRIVFAALLSTILLRKSIKVDQWRAITIISCAATALCLEDMKADDTGGDSVWTDESFAMPIAVGTAFVSAAGGVLIERYLNISSSSTNDLPLSSVTKDKEHEHIMPSEVKRLRQTSVHPLPHPCAQAKPPTLAAAMLWEQQGTLASFSAAFATLYVVLFMQDAIRPQGFFKGWTEETVVVILMQAVQGIIVALTIQRCGILFRLILGTLCICLCIVFESLFFSKPIVFREFLNIVMVIVGSNMYGAAL